MSEPIKITWLGHSCFRVETQGYIVILDPYEDGSVPGLAPLRETADLVLCSHSHHDHSAAGLVTLRQTGAPCPFVISKVSCAHDNEGGVHRGMAAG